MTMHYNAKNIRAGFSLPELMIALVIIGIIATLIGGYIGSTMKKARKTKAESELREFNIGIERYREEVGQWPQTLKDLIKKPTSEAAAKKWDGPYFGKKGITEIPEDPWKNKYKYKITPNSKHPYELYSDGDGEGPKVDAWDL